MSDVQWTVSGPDGTTTTPKASKAKQLPYWPAYSITADMDPNTKLFCERYNTMQQRLIELGEMKAK